ncbi:MAG: hypothetical protein K8R58_06095 [Bacteroidales bacterium]|nr:hypothetical protein [Bacteroidales bacterium]
MKFLWFIVLLIVIPNFSFSQNHIDTIKNNTVSFRFGLPFHTSKNFSEIDIYKYNQSFNVYYQRVLLRPGSFLIKTEFGLGTVGDACESRFCPVVDLSLNTDYGIKNHQIILSCPFRPPLQN